MIYFIKDTAALSIKIGYSKNAKKRLNHLQTATPNQLVLLGTINGGLDHEAAYHEKFAAHRLQGEWFKGEILNEVLGIIAKATANPEKPLMNLLISGDSTVTDMNAVRLALEEVHAATPLGWIVTGGERNFDHTAWHWASQKKIDIYRYYPKWRTQGRFAGFKTGPQMIRSMFDPKTLLILLGYGTNKSTLSLIRMAERKGIPVIKKQCAPSRNPSLEWTSNGKGLGPKMLDGAKACCGEASEIGLEIRLYTHLRPPAAT